MMYVPLPTSSVSYINERYRQGIKPHSFIVKLVATYVGTSLLVMEVLYFGVWCRPFSNYWAVPTPNGSSKAMPFLSR